jgi:hypothetical protein
MTTAGKQFSLYLLQTQLEKKIIKATAMAGVTKN